MTNAPAYFTRFKKFYNAIGRQLRTGASFCRTTPTAKSSAENRDQENVLKLVIIWAVFTTLQFLCNLQIGPIS
jgi:hypothetical protein